VLILLVVGFVIAAAVIQKLSPGRKKMKTNFDGHEVLVRETAWIVMERSSADAQWRNFHVWDVRVSRRQKYSYWLSYDGKQFARNRDLVRLEMDHPLGLQAIQQLITQNVTGESSK